MSEEYADTRETKGIKLFFYLKSGLSLLNEFKNLFYFVLGAYIALKLSNPLWMMAMFVSSIPILIGIGCFCVHLWNKILEWERSWHSWRFYNIIL